MTTLTAVNGRVLAVGLDAWGGQVAAAAHAQLAEAADRLVSHGLSVLTAVRAADGIWIGPSLVPGAGTAGALGWQAQRRGHAELLTPASLRAGSPDGDVPLAALAILAVTRRLLSAPARLGRG
jgi:hypothetical protein